MNSNSMNGVHFRKENEKLRSPENLEFGHFIVKLSLQGLKGNVPAERLFLLIKTILFVTFTLLPSPLLKFDPY